MNAVASRVHPLVQVRTHACEGFSDRPGQASSRADYLMHVLVAVGRLPDAVKVNSVWLVKEDVNTQTNQPVPGP